MEVKDLRIGMHVRVNDIEHDGILTVNEIKLRSGVYEATLYDEEHNCFFGCMVEKIVPYEPFQASLTWIDIRDIVRLADTSLDFHDKKELIKMGERGYYEDVLRAYHCQLIDRVTCCIGNSGPKCDSGAKCEG